MTRVLLGSGWRKTCCPTCLLTLLACSSSRMDAKTSALQRTALITSLQGWKKISLASGSSRSGAGEPATTSLEEPTYQYCDDEVISDGISYALLSGEARTAWAISHGCIPIGGERIVTRSKGNVIYEIDGKPATEVLKEYLPERALARRSRLDALRHIACALFQRSQLHEG